MYLVNICSLCQFSPGFVNVFIFHGKPKMTECTLLRRVKYPADQTDSDIVGGQNPEKMLLNCFQQVVKVDPMMSLCQRQLLKAPRNLV